jgi:hypothetical protein
LIIYIIQEEPGTIIGRFSDRINGPFVIDLTLCAITSNFHLSFLSLNTSGHSLESKTLDMALSLPPWTGAGHLEAEEFAEALQHSRSRFDR